MSLLPCGERDASIIAKEACSEYAHKPFNGCTSIISRGKGRNGVDQVEDRCYKGSEEITPLPADPGYVVMQLSSVEDKEENTKGQFSPRQLVVYYTLEVPQNHYAKYNLSYQKK